MPSSILKPASTDLQSLFFDTSPLPCLILGDGGTILQANAAAATFFQCEATQLRQYCIADLVSATDDEAAHAGLKNLGPACKSSFTVCCKTGHTLTAAQVFQNSIPADEALTGMVLVPAAAGGPHEDEALMASMVNETSDVLTTADLNFEPITWSEAAERLYGLTRAQALGQNVRAHLGDIRYHDTTPEEVRRLALTTGKWRGEMGFTRPTDGKKLTLLITFKLKRNKAGAPLHYIISGTDISDRKESEAKLRESENRFREVANSAPVGIWMSEVENKLIYISKPLADYIGVKAEAFTKAVWVSRIHPDDLHGVLEKYRDHFLQQLPVTLIYRLQRACGAYHWVQDTGTPRVLSDGTFLGYIGSVIDINDTKRREEQMRYQATLMNHVQDSVVTTDINFIVQSWNSVAAEIYGLTSADAIGRRLPGLLHFKYVSTTKEEALEALVTNGVWKGEVDVDVQGEERNFLFTVTYITDTEGARTGIMAVGREITDRKRAERRLQESESFYRNLITNSLDCILLTDAAGSITFASASIKTILGHEIEEAVGRNAFGFVHPDDRTHARTAFEDELMEHPELKFIQIRILKQDGTWLWCMVRGHNLLDNPHIGCIALYLHDDSQRKQANDALKESEKRFRALIKDLKLGVTLEDAEGRILMHNRATAELLRVSEASLGAATVYGLFANAVHEDETPFARDEWPMRRALHTRKPVGDVVVGICTAGGERVWLLVNANPVLDEAGNIRHIISSFSDITERKNLAQRLMEEQVARQRLLTQATIDAQERERKEMGKELHDNIGQQLVTTKLYLDLAQVPHTSDPAAMLARASKSITGIINEVRAISHSLVPPTLGDLGLVASVQELIGTISLLQQLAIDFDASHFAERGLPENARLMLYRIVQEALNNIIEHAHATTVHIQLTRNHRAVVLQIRDNGHGFDPASVRKGLGVANMRNRAELFGGKVTLKAAPGQGCTLKVTIPAAQMAGEGELFQKPML